MVHLRVRRVGDISSRFGADVAIFVSAAEYRWWCPQPERATVKPCDHRGRGRVHGTDSPVHRHAIDTELCVLRCGARRALDRSLPDAWLAVRALDLVRIGLLEHRRDDIDPALQTAATCRRDFFI